MIHLPPQPKTKVPFYKNIKAAIDDVGLPSESRAVESEFAGLLDIAESKRQQDRLDERGTLDKQNSYVTDAGKECGRQVVYANLNVPRTDPTDVSGKLKMKFGNIGEETMALLYTDAGWEVEREVHVRCVAKDGHEVTGRIDFLLRKDGIVRELKCVASDSFKWTLARREPGKPDHRAQLNLYLHWMTEQGIPFRLGQLVYFLTDAPKGTPNPLAFPLAYDRDKALADIERLAELWRMSEAGIVPDRPPHIEEIREAGGRPPVWPCLYCDWKTHCWNGGDAA